MTPSRPLAFRWFLAFAVLFSIQVVPRFGADSLVNDEMAEVADGYFYLTRGDVTLHDNHAPFSMAWRAFPLLFLKLDGTAYGDRDMENRAYRFYFVDNLSRLEVMTALPRLMVFLLGLGIGFLLYRWTKGTARWSLAALFLWAFEPTLLAHSGVAKDDLMTAFFVLAAFQSLQVALEEGRGTRFFATGLLTGMAVMTKWYALIILPVMALMFLLSRRVRREKSGWAAPTGLLLAGFLGWVGIVYLPGTVNLAGHPDPWRLAVRALRQVTEFSTHGYPAFFLGRVDPEPRWGYFPNVFLLKSTLPFLLLLGLALVLAAAGKVKVAAVEAWVPLLLFISLLRVQNLGVRYLLPAMPFLILLAARAAEWLASVSRHRTACRTAVALLLAWHAASVLMNFPHHLSYFNDLIPSSRKASLLADSNLDWGQDHKRLVKKAKERGWKRVKLAYLGGVDPYYYGLDWQPWTRQDLDGPQAGWTYVVNVSFLQMAPAFFPDTMPIVRSWISHERPAGRVADSWYYFETPEGARKKDATPLIPSVPYFRYVRGAPQ